MSLFHIRRMFVGSDARILHWECEPHLSVSLPVSSESYYNVGTLAADNEQYTRVPEVDNAEHPEDKSHVLDTANESPLHNEQDCWRETEHNPTRSRSIANTRDVQPTVCTPVHSGQRRNEQSGHTGSVD
jgi:hypothetical protein